MLRKDRHTLSIHKDAWGGLTVVMVDVVPVRLGGKRSGEAEDWIFGRQREGREAGEKVKLMEKSWLKPPVSGVSDGELARGL